MAGSGGSVVNPFHSQVSSVADGARADRELESVHISDKTPNVKTGVYTDRRSRVLH
jgi:hypothetical protein